MASVFESEDMLQIYMYENEEHLEILRNMILEYQNKGAFDEEAIREIFRVMHTVKASASMMMFEDIAKVAHKMEDVFYLLRDGYTDVVPFTEVMDLVCDMQDYLGEQIENLKDPEKRGINPEQILSKIQKTLDKLEAAEKAAPKDGGGDVFSEKKEKSQEPVMFYIAPAKGEPRDGGKYYRIYMTYSKSVDLANIHAYKTVLSMEDVADKILFSPSDILSDPDSAQEILDRGFRMMIRSNASEAAIREKLPLGYELDAVDIFLSNEAEFSRGFDSDIPPMHEQIRNDRWSKMRPGDFVIKPQVKAPDKDADPGRIEKQAYLRVEIVQMDRIHSLSARLTEILHATETPDYDEVKQIAEELREVILVMRKVRLTNVFAKMNRIIFDIARKETKEIEMDMVGDDLELDRRVVDILSDPLMHLVRNSADHGIELPRDRIEAGKNPCGKILLSAKIEDGSLFVSVSDDGCGMDCDKIFNKAKRRGVVPEDARREDYDEQEIYQMITLPGFSTSEVISEYSGRGVGMDVVMDMLGREGGDLIINSRPGIGTRMTMRIPLLAKDGI